MGRGFTSGGQESGSVLSAAVGKIQASTCKRWVESLPLLFEDRSCERFAVRLPLDHMLALRK